METQKKMKNGKYSELDETDSEIIKGGSKVRGKWRRKLFFVCVSRKEKFLRGKKFPT